MTIWRLAVLFKTSVRIIPVPLMVLFCSFVTTSASAQQLLNRELSLSLNDVQLGEALQYIQKAVDVKFVFSSTAIPVQQRVSVNVVRKKMHEVLSDILSPYNIKFDFVNGRILLYNDLSKNIIEDSKKVDASHNIVGIVTNLSGEPLSGVTILIKGTGTGTHTNADGTFSILKNSNDVLVVSFVGYKTQELHIGNQIAVDIKMEHDVPTLGEIVVTGYQDVRKESYTGSTITASGQDLKSVNPINLLQSLQTFDPSFRVFQNNNFGSDPNWLPNINVRGTTALPTTGLSLLNMDNLGVNPNLPTFILDGFQVSLQTVYDLDINRIESVTFLKDAAATAIYGSRAANGVLVIKTKTPKEEQLHVYYNYNLSITSPDLTVYDLLNAKEKLEYERLAGVYDSKNKYNANIPQYTLDDSYYSKLKNVVSGVNTYWLAEPVQTAANSNHSLAITGGTKSIRYSVTARCQDVNGVMKNSHRNRYGADLKMIYQPNDKLSIGNTVSVSEVKAQESPYGDFSDYVQMNPYYKKRDDNGNVIRVLDSVPYYDNSRGIRQRIVVNPMYDATLGSFNRNKYSLLIDELSLNWNITPAWMVKGIISYQRNQSTADIFKSPFRNEYYSLVTDATQRGEYDFTKGNESTIDGNFLIAYNVSLGKHLVNASLGANLRVYDIDSKGITATGFTSDSFVGLSSTSSYLEKDPPAGSIYNDRLVGGFLSVNYSYKNKYLIDFAGRLDGSSKFGSQNKIAPFWSAGIGWNLHKESALSLPTQINVLRIKATTGLTGEVSFPPYLTKTTYSYYADAYSTGLGASPIAYGNENLRWQRTKNYNVSIELAAFQNKFTFTGTYYYKLTKDLLTDVIVPPSTGFSYYKDNLGVLENKGFEILTKVNVIQTKQWNINMSARLAGNRNRIKQISQSLSTYNDEADASQTTSPLPRYYEGQPIDAIYVVRSFGIDPQNGREILVKKNGTLTYDYDVKDIVKAGTASPLIDGFAGPNIRYKNFTLDVQFYLNLGGQAYNQTLVDKVENADLNYNVDKRVLYQRWKKPGDVTMFKDIADRSLTNVTSRFVQNNNVVELYSAGLSYETPSAITNKIHLSALRWSITANNIARWSTIKMERGIEYPFARTVTLSVNATF